MKIPMRVDEQPWFYIEAVNHFGGDVGVVQINCNQYLCSNLFPLLQCTFLNGTAGIRITQN